MLNQFKAFYERTVVQHPAVTLLVILLVLVLMSLRLGQTKLDASSDALVLEGDKSLEVFREVGKRYGSEDFLIVTYAPKDFPTESIYSDVVLARIKALRDDLAALAGVSSVVSILDVPLLYSPPVTIANFSEGIHYLSEPDVDRKLVAAEFRNSPIYKNLLTSQDASTTAIQVNLTRDEKYFELLNARDSLREKRRKQGLSAAEKLELENAEQRFRDYATQASEHSRDLVENVRHTLDQHRAHATIFLGGVTMIAADMIRFIQSDLVIFGAGIVIFIIGMLSVIFRRARWVLVPLLTCLITCTLMLGYLAWLDWRMTVISSNFVALLLIITLSITIHLIVRYRELHAAYPDWSQRQLVMDTVTFMAKPCIYTALTTIVAFASLVVSGIRPVIDFGWMMTIGVSLALVMTFLILPAGLLLLKKTEPIPRAPKTASATLRFAAVTEAHGQAILAISALLLVFSAIGIKNLKVENRFIDYFHPDTEIYQGMETIDQQLGGTIPMEIIVRHKANGAAVAALDDGEEDDFADMAPVDEEYSDDFADDFADDAAGGESEYQYSYWFSRAGLEDIDKIHRFLDAQPETGKVLSLATIYHIMSDVAGAVDDIQLAIIKQGLTGTIKNTLIKPYLNEDNDETRITVRVMETSRSLKRDELLHQVRQFLIKDMGYDEDQFDVTGMLVLYNNMLQSLFKSQIATLGAVFLAITIMFTILFRSVGIALIAITPNLLAAGLVLGIMGWLGIPLDMMTITIAAITVGIGVDDTIHYIHRFKEEFPKDCNYVATMYRCHGSIGKAMYYTSVTIIAGFSILTLSNFTPSFYFGFLTGLAMFAALMGALLLLPQLIIVFKPLGANQPIAALNPEPVAEAQ